MWLSFVKEGKVGFMKSVDLCIYVCVREGRGCLHMCVCVCVCVRACKCMDVYIAHTSVPFKLVNHLTDFQ